MSIAREHIVKALTPWSGILSPIDADAITQPWLEPLFWSHDAKAWGLVRCELSINDDVVAKWWKGHASKKILEELEKKKESPNSDTVRNWFGQVHSSWGLANALWPARALASESLFDLTPFLGIADPRANLVTLAFRTADTFDEATAEHLLEDVFDQFLRHARDYDNWLQHRPGLALILVARKQDANTQAQLIALRKAYHGSLHRIGETAPDVDVRWIWEGEDPSVLAAEILAGHPPGPPWPPAKTVVLKEGPIKAATERLGYVKNALVACRNATAQNAHVFFDLGRSLADLDESVGAIAVDKAETQEPSERNGSAMSLLGMRIKARHWDQDNGLHVPLSPITIISSENAAGKTSFTEALAQLYEGRPRLRAVLPDRSMEWGKNPQLGVLRIDSQEASKAATLLPLFPDDNDLSKGVPGELGLLTWWPLAEGDSEWAQLRNIFSEIQAISRQTGDVLQTLPNAAVLPDGTFTIEPPGIMVADVQKARAERADLLREDESNLSDWLIAVRLEQDILRSGFKRQLDVLAEREVATDKAWEDSESLVRPGDVDTMHLEGEWAALEKVHELLQNNKRHLTQLEDDEQRLAQERADFGKTWPDDSTISSTYMASILEHWLPPRGPLEQSDWVDFRDKILGKLGFSPSVRKIVFILLKKTLRDLEEQLATVSDRLAEEILVGPIEDALDRYLNIGLEIHDPTKCRPNTARQVVLGIAKRLARWVTVGGVDCPVLVLDEPTLGQDAAGGARSLERLLRLRRVAEAHRWANCQDDNLCSPASLLHDQWAENFQPMQAKVLKPGNELPVWAHGPQAPQIIVSSFRLEVLGAVADLAGLVLSSGVREELQKLVPPQWRSDVCDALEHASKEWKKVNSLGVKNHMPPQILRFFWDADSFPKPQSPKGDQKAWLEYGDQAIKALDTLGLHVLAAQARLELRQNHGGDIPEAVLARKLLLWMIWTDVLPAAFASSEDFDLSGVCFREFPAVSGEAATVGPFRLRRVGAHVQWLPPDPLNEKAWNAALVPSAKTQSNLPEDQKPVEIRPGTRDVETSAAQRAAPDPLATVDEIPKVAPAIDVPAIEKSARLPDIAPSASVWRVHVAQSDWQSVLEGAIRQAGMLPSSGIEPAQVVLDLDSQDAGFGRSLRRWMSPGKELRNETFASEQLDKLTGLLLERRIHSWQAQPPADPDEAHPFRIAVATHIPDQVPDPRTALLYGALEPTGTDMDEAWQGQVLQSWEARIATGLQKARDALGGRAIHEVLFHLQCHLGAAMRAGALFHFQTGFSVSCEQNGDIWDIDNQPVKGPGIFNEPEPLEWGDAEAGEFHLLLSVTRDVKDDYRSWRTEFNAVMAGGLHFKAEKIGREAISRSSVVDSAHQVAEQILKLPTPPRKNPNDPPLLRRIRIFSAAPVAFALALGRTMNTWGDIVTMDFSKAHRKYFESFRFRA